MNGNDWGTLLNRGAARVSVASAPLAEIVAGAGRRRRRRRRQWTAVVAVTIVAATGGALVWNLGLPDEGRGADRFTSDAPVDEAMDPVTDHVGTYQAVGLGGDSALLEGSVHLDGGCFIVELASGERYLPFFPADEVAWRDDGLLYGGSVYGDGDVVSVRGSETGTPGTVPRQCASADYTATWTVAQND